MSATLLVAGCGRDPDWVAQNDVRICRDSAGRRIADAACDRRPGGGGGGFYYIPRGGSVPAIGERVGGGSAFATPGTAYARAPAGGIVRGGFGATARGGAHGGGGGGE